MSGSWAPVDFGDRVPGIGGLSATGTTQATAFQITKKVSVFGTVAPGGCAVLPSSFASGTELQVLNRGANALSVYPAGSDRIESYGTATALSVPAGANATFVSFDAPLAPPPRTWWTDGGAGTDGAFATLLVTGTSVFDGAVTVNAIEAIGGTLTVFAPVVANSLTLTQAPLLPASGGTGATTAPSAGQVPVGTAGGAYAPVTPATAQAVPSAPTGTASTTGVMMGLAGSVTPAASGTVLLMACGTIYNASAIADGARVQLRYGTGTAPANAAALAGTAAGSAPQYVAATTAAKAPFSAHAVVSGLTVGTAYWFDLSLAAITGGTANISDVSLSAVEVP